MMDTLVHGWSQATTALLDVVYPPSCISCGRAGFWWCAGCRASVHVYHTSFCPTCGETKRDGHGCSGTFPFSSLIACGPYGAPALRRLITAFKYRSASCLEADLSTWLKDVRGQFLEPWPWANRNRFLVTSIPGDRNRVRERGRDHAWHIAQTARDVFIPWAETKPLLIRTRSIGPNAKLPTTLIRSANVKGAFQCTGPIHDPVLLVDDVFTTGATAQEAARTLIAAGAPEVHILVLAKGG
jgi:predicted amidophosphoribosyltransferase